MKKSLSLLLVYCLTLLPLYANLPVNDGCCEKCGCDNDSDSPNNQKKDGTKPGNNSPSSGTGGAISSSVSIWVNWGSPANERMSSPSQFTIYSKSPTPVMFSPQIIQYRNQLFDRFSGVVINYNHLSSVRGSKYQVEEYYEDGLNGRTLGVISHGGARETLSTELPSDVTHEVNLFTTNRRVMTFRFKSGESVGKQIGETATMNNTLVMVDSSGNPTTTNPVYYDRYFPSGNVLRYSADTGCVVSYRTATGRTITPTSPTVGVEPIYDEDGTIRQVWSRSDGLADVVVTESGVSYEIRCYAPELVGAKSSGVYTVTGNPHTVWRIENPNPGTNTRIKVTRTTNGTSEVSFFEYSHNTEGWTLKKPDDLAQETQSTSWDDSGTVKVITTVEKTPSGQLASKVARTYQKFPFGDRIVNVSVDPDGANLRTQTAYYTDSNNSGSYGRIKTENRPDGSWSSYQYDANGRETVEITPWKNSEFNSAANLAKAQYRSYSPVDNRDTVDSNDSRARIKETKVLGITTAKTYYAYYYDGNDYVEVEEQCVSGNAAYGASGNLRTERRYYAKGNASSAGAGRLHTIKYPDGRQDTYTYEYGTWSVNANPAQSTFTSSANGTAVRMTVTHGTTSSPNGIAGKTFRDVTIYDDRGCEAFNATELYTGSGYTRVNWTANTFDGQRRKIAELKSNGELTETTWNCCNKASETLPDGTQYTYVYDAMKRLVSKTKVGTGTQPDLVTTYAYDAANRKVSETVTGGNLSVSASWEYNLAGQLVRSVDFQGLITTYSYLQGSSTGSSRKGETVTTVKPGGFTTIKAHFCDGQRSSVTGTAQVSNYFDYGVNSDGSTWSKTNIGGTDSARWRKTTIALVYRPIQVEKSGYNGTVIAQLFYNNKNQLVRQTKTGSAATLFEYDALGNVVRQGLDVDDNGTLDLAGNDRIVDTETSADATWITTTKKVYATAGNSTTTTVEVRKERLSGFTNGVVAETQVTDIHGNVTTSATAVDRPSKTVTESIIYPESTVAEQIVTVNGLKTSARTKTNLAIAFGYDALGRIVSATDPRTGTALLTYHTAAGKNGLKATVTDAVGNVTSYDYDTATGRLIWEKNALDQYTRYAYNARGQITNVWGDTQYPVEFGYNEFGERTTMRTYRSGTSWNAAGWPTGITGDLTAWTFDPASGLITAKTDAANQSVNYTYTVDGKLASRTWARGIVTNYTYSAAAGELLNVDYSDSTPDITLTYNRLGQPATIQDAAGTRTFTYNAALDLISESINGIYAKGISRAYTTTGMKGRPLSMSVDGNSIYAYDYDSYGRINKITTPAGAFNYTRLANSDLVSQLTRPNGVGTTWSYEPHRNLVTQVQNGSVSTFGYTSNAIGNRVSMGRSGSAFTTPDILTYGYNSRSEVISAQSNADSAYNYAYSFDSIGNRLTASLAGQNFSYTSNALNQYTEVNSAQPTYDTDGNMLTRDGWTQVWNGENRLIEISRGSTKLQFAYDYMGRRVEKKVFSGSSLTRHTRFVYDGYKLAEELDALSGNAVMRRYSWQPDAVAMDVPLSVFDASANASYSYTTDANKNVAELADVNGNVVAHYEYSPFGMQTKAVGNYASTNPFRFSSEYFDAETGLVYYNYRYYDQKLGRWLSRDPIEEQGGVNLYGFVNNSTTGKYDFLGSTCCGGKKLPRGQECCNKRWPYDPRKKCCHNNLVYDKMPQKQCDKDIAQCHQQVRDMAKSFGLSQNIANAIISELATGVGGYFVGLVVANVYNLALPASTAGTIGAVVLGGVALVASYIDISSAIEALREYAKLCKEMKEKHEKCCY